MPHHTGRHLVHRKNTAKQKETFDYIVRFFMVATPLFEVPQAWQIYSSRSAGDVSLATWGFFCAADIVWIIYAIKLGSMPLQIAYSLYLIIEVSIVIGILLY
jgi:uncharacterized protein with PQ loop repeat